MLFSSTSQKNSLTQVTHTVRVYGYLLVLNYVRQHVLVFEISNIYSFTPTFYTKNIGSWCPKNTRGTKIKEGTTIGNYKTGQISSQYTFLEKILKMGNLVEHFAPFPAPVPYIPAAHGAYNAIIATVSEHSH